MTNVPDQDPLGPKQSLPVPGWYADPEHAGQHRWWDGTQWTQATLSGDAASNLPPGGPSTGPPLGDNGLEPIGPWLSSVMDVIRARAGHLFTLTVVISVPVAMLSGILMWQALKGLTIINDQANNTFEFEGFSAEAGYLFFGSFLLSTLSGLILAAAIVHQAGNAQAGSPLPWGDSLVHAVLRLPRVLGAFLGLVLVYIVLGVAFVLLIAAGASVGGVGAVILGFLAFVAVALYVGVRLSLVSTGAAVGPRGVNSFASSWQLTGGKFMPILGRILLLVALLVGIQLTGSIITGAFGDQVDPEASIIIVADLFGASNAPFFLALQVVGAILGGFTSAIWGVGLFFLYRALGGRIAPELGLSEIGQPGQPQMP